MKNGKTMTLYWVETEEQDCRNCVFSGEKLGFCEANCNHGFGYWTNEKPSTRKSRNARKNEDGSVSI